MITGKRIIDLSYPIVPEHWRSNWGFSLEATKDFAKTGHLFRQTELTIDCHAFTHIDAPAHFVPGGRTVDELPLDQLIGPGIVADLSHLGANACVTAAELAQHSPELQAGHMLLVRTSWDQVRHEEPTRFFTDAPYMAVDACEWIVEKGLNAVGFDFPADRWIRYKYLDPARELQQREAVTHDIILRGGIVLIESVTNLHLLAQPAFDLFVVPLNVQGAEGMPVRVIAFGGS